MVLSLTIPDHYGYVVLSCLVGHFVTSTCLGGMVMQARKRLDVPYPNLYATPGFHKEADAFNRVQRGHQSMFETSPVFLCWSILGGLQYPLWTAVGGLLYHVGSYFFMLGYADTALNVATARYAKGGALKWLGLFMNLGAAIAFAGKCNAWW